MKEYKPIKLGGSVVAVQGKADVTGGNHDKGKKGTKKYLPDDGWGALSANAKPKPIESWKEGTSDKIDKSVPSAKTANTTKSLTKLKKLVSALQKCDKNGDDVSSTLTVEDEGLSHFQDALGRHNGHHPKIFLELRHRTCDSKGTQHVGSLTVNRPYQIYCLRGICIHPQRSMGQC